MIEKPAGMPSAPDISKDTSALDWAKNYIKVSCQKPGNAFVGLVHRLDRPVGGLMAFAKTSKAASRLSEQIRVGIFKKKYIGLTTKLPPANSGELRHQLLKDRKRNIVAVLPEHEKQAGSKLAITRFELKAQKNGLVIIELEPVTGRPHQLRAQCAEMGCPLFGDVKYGGQKDLFGILTQGTIGLFAWQLTLKHPITKVPMLFESQTDSTILR